MPNLLTTPRKWKSKAVYLKAETTYATDAAPTGIANWMEARNVSLTSFDAETVDRNIDQPFLGVGGKLITSVWSKLSFDIALVGGGAAGVAPKWGPAMLPAAFAETIVASTSVAYNLVSTAIGSLTAYLNIDGVLYKFIGCRGDVKAAIASKGIPLLKFELTSLYTAPSTLAMPTVDRTGWPVEDGVNSVNTGKITLNGVDLAFANLEWGCGNKIARIDLPGPQREVVIQDRAPTAAVTVLAPPLATFDPYALANAGNTVTLTNTHGTVAGKKVKTDLKVRVIGIAEDQVEGMAAYKLTLEPTPVAGNDEIATTLL